MKYGLVMASFGLVTFSVLDYKNRLWSLRSSFEGVAADNNDYCTFFNNMANNEAATDTNVNSLIDSIRDGAQGLTCQTNRA